MSCRRDVKNGDRRHDDLGTVGAERGSLFLRLLVREDEDAAIAFDRRSHREARAGVSGGRFNDDAARLELTGPFRILDDLHRDAVLYGRAGVEHLYLGIDGRLQAFRDAVEADEWG